MDNSMRITLELPLGVYSGKKQLENGNIVHWVLTPGTSKSDRDIKSKIKNLTSEEIENILAKTVIKDEDPFGPAVPEEDWEIYS